MGLIQPGGMILRIAKGGFVAGKQRLDAALFLGQQFAEVFNQNDKFLGIVLGGNLLTDFRDLGGGGCHRAVL